MLEGMSTMSKTVILALLASAVLGSADAALASEPRAVEPGAPAFVGELGAVRTATVGGTVAELRRDGHFILADAEGGKITVDAEHLRLESLAPGQMITITGRLDDGELEADHAIREDGSVVVRERRADRDDED
jgi:hypothetical protein